MASWKERGEVLDSDDEEELISQHNEQKGGVTEPAIEHPLNPFAEVLDLDDDLVNREQDAQQNERRESRDSKQGVFGAGTKATTTSNEPTTPLSTPRKSQRQPLSSPILPTIFKVPDLEGLLDEGVAPQATTNQNLQDDLPVEDDISTSYVRITSPSPLLPSSPPASLPQLPDLRISMSATKSQAPDMEKPGLDEQANENPEQESDEEPSYPMRRALRQRNAIQLHPYVVEQEKYRQTLKSRGIAPMRLASSQVDQRPVARFDSSPDREFRQNQDTQEVEADTGESQGMDFDWEPQSSPQPPAERPFDDSMDRDEAQHDDDDELPDIEELLRSRPHMSTQKEPKKAPKRAHIKSYSHKFKRPVLPRILTQSGPSIRPSTRGHHVFDVPDSPPATSPQLSDVLSRRSGGMRSLEPSPSWLSQDELQMQTADLPTPATSAMKPTPNPATIDSDSDDPFASDLENSVASSSSDESVQIRNISKKFRGVLPASHLRLDQKKKPKTSNRTNRDTHSISPVKSMPRRGIALPRTQAGAAGGHRSPTATMDTGFAFFSDKSDENLPADMAMDDDDGSPLEDLFPESRKGYAEEDDRIDAMLPSRKRHRSSRRLSKKRRTGETSFQRTESGAYQRQPKITEHLGRAPKAVSNSKPNSNRQRRSKTKRTATTPQRPPPPMLGILDVAETSGQGQEATPDFIRIAARAARSRTTRGRHQPGGKFFRLSTREDTEDVQTILQDWKAGKIQPKNIPSANERRMRAPRSPLSQIENNHQSHFERPLRKAGPPIRPDASEPSRTSRRLLVSRRQQSMNEFVRRDQAPVISSRPSIRHEPNNNSGHGQSIVPRPGHHSARPAQLEGAEKDSSHRYPSTTFKSSKRALDALYRSIRRRPTPSANLQLTRFLADEDVVRHSIETRPKSTGRASNSTAQSAVSRPVPQKLGRQKPQPRRIDIGAALYRQPSNPLILEHFAPEIVAGQSDKLQGLAKFGVRYTQHFDILPLPPGVFFQNSTFVGSGRLSKMMKIVPRQADIAPVVISLNLANPFSWAAWNENVSSEFGLCFDWLADQFERNDPSAPDVSEIAIMNVVDGTLDYVQQSPSFDGPFNPKMILSRMLEVIRDFSSRFAIKQITSDIIRPAIKVLFRICTVSFHLLLVARSEQECAALVFDFEDLLKATAHLCVELLLSQDLAELRRLYDDLQYLSYRERGIGDDQYAVEAWVVLIKVLREAKVPRGSFWDVVNPMLTCSDLSKVTDAPTLEKVWYSMYSLLPLCEFDEHGVAIRGSSKKALFDNWQLPQQILKRIFSLYTSNPRQPPGFTEYCRSLVGRCHYLMVNWDWWNCSPIIGTLFDFFASHNLAHLRNEEVYSSPTFLDHLDENPPLSVEPEDRSFHIFLKIVAFALKHFTAAREFKTTRNLVARILPNHGRQYPKEEDIHQRDLCSLQNHHDLLTTLIWAAPKDQRRSITMAENIVQRGVSHAAAFKVHINAFKKLTRFSLRDGNLHEREVVKNWQDADMSSLITQCKNVEAEVRSQAGPDVTESNIASVVLNNTEQVEGQILLLLSAWGELVEISKNGDIAKAAFNPDLLSTVIEFVRDHDRALPTGILHECLQIINAYVRQVPKYTPVAANNPNRDSQDGLNERDWYMAEMITVPLLNLLQMQLVPLTRALLQKNIQHGQEDGLLYLVQTLAGGISLLHEAGSVDIKDYALKGQYAVFRDRDTNSNAKKFWPVFLARLMQGTQVFPILPVSVVNEFSCYAVTEWMWAMIDPASKKEYVDELTDQMIIHFGSFPIKTGYSNLDNLLSVIKYLGDNLKLESVVRAHPTTHARLFPASLQPMPKSTLSNFGFRREEASKLLVFLQEQMQCTLKKMTPDSEEHRHYVLFARNVSGCIIAYLGDYVPILGFFRHSSVYYHPAYPNLFDVNLKGYCVKLQSPSQGLARTVFYFLYHGWVEAVASGSEATELYLREVKNGLKHLSFLNYMLEEFIPICLQAALKTNMWALFYHFINATIHQVKVVLETRPHGQTNADAGPDYGRRVFDALRNIFEVATSGLNQQTFQEGTFAIILYFWGEVWGPMHAYACKVSAEPMPALIILQRYFADLESAVSNGMLLPVGESPGTIGVFLNWNELKNDMTLLKQELADNTELSVKGQLVKLPITWEKLLEVKIAST